MSDMCTITENVDIENNEEPLDPRIQIELERANNATIEINNLETQLDHAQQSFQDTFTNCKQRLATLASKLGRCVERARPYYDACKQAKEAQIDTQKAAQEYQNSVELHHTAQDNYKLIDTKSSKIDVHTRQEYIKHLNLKVRQTEQDKQYYERIHEEKSKLYQEYERQRITLYKSLTRAINKSKPYFNEKVKAENELKNKKSGIEDVQKAISQAKKNYRMALNNLEQISEEIHFKRKLPLREPAVGAEKPDEYIELPNFELTEFPKLDHSDESSDTEQSTQSLELCSNSSQLSKSIRKIRLKNETPLLTHLFGAHKSQSDSNLNFHSTD